MECMGFSGCMDVAMDLMERFTKGVSPFCALLQTLQPFRARGLASWAASTIFCAAEQPPFLCVRQQEPCWYLAMHTPCVDAKLCTL